MHRARHLRRCVAPWVRWQVAHGDQVLLIQLPPLQRPAVQVAVAAASLTADSAFVLDFGMCA